MKIMTFLLVLLAVFSQTSTESNPVSAVNIAQFAPIQQIDFQALPSEFTNGWFAMNENGTRLVVSDRDGLVYLLDDAGSVLEMIELPQVEGSYPGSLIDAAFAENRVYLLRVLEGDVYLNEDLLEIPGEPVSVWAEAGMGHDTVFIELQPTAESGAAIVEVQIADNRAEMVRVIEYAPGQDPDAVVRVGRIMPPYAVTSTLEGTITVWDLVQADALYTVDNGSGEPSVFGNINLPPTHFVWRDNGNQNLYLLDLLNGENQVLDELNGEYAQWFFLSTDASVVLAVNLNFEPVVIAWDVESRTRTVLGAYRPCGRPQPDAARLSEDGSTLVIGCDTGLEIWRIGEA